MFFECVKTKIWKLLFPERSLSHWSLKADCSFACFFACLVCPFRELQLYALSFSWNSIPVERLVMFFSGLEPASNDIGSVSDLKWRESPVASYRTGIHMVWLPQSQPAVLSPSRSMFPIPYPIHCRSSDEQVPSERFGRIKVCLTHFSSFRGSHLLFLDGSLRVESSARKLVSASAPMTSVWTAFSHLGEPKW